jgi:hypothetical protein
MYRRCSRVEVVGKTEEYFLCSVHFLCKSYITHLETIHLNKGGGHARIVMPSVRLRFLTSDPSEISKSYRSIFPKLIRLM